MFNHARTLLANLAPTAAQSFDVLGEEAIPSGFTPRKLPTYLREIRRVLFGDDPDRYMTNYRVRQFMTLLHATPLIEYIRELDGRITYSVGSNNELLDPALFLPKVIALGSTTGQLTVVGKPQIPDVSGRMFHSFRVTVDSGSALSIDRQTRPVKTVREDYTLTQGLSGQIALPDAGYKFYVNTDTVGQRWLVEMYNRPRWELGALAASAAKSGETVFLELFGATPQEPMLTFRNLWFEHKELPLRLGGLLMAMIYKIDAL